MAGPHCHKHAFTTGWEHAGCGDAAAGNIGFMLLNAQHRQLDYALLLVGDQQRYLLAYN
ncbi:hypothetical protein M5G07_03550 [Serratia symbiotica]|nr:hypothetical protein [Serratia symbiotica]